jgi:UPF0242 C-terminal PAS-like domain/Uncharacterised protein family (UPF0242) N-terminus
MKNVSPSSQTTLGAFLLVYWIPLVVLSIYASPRKGWILLLTGLLLSIVGALCLWLLMRQREQSMENQIQNLKDSLSLQKAPPAPIPPPPIDEEKLHSLEQALETHERKHLESSRLLEDKQQLILKTVKDNERYQMHVENLKQELDTVKSYLNEQLTHYKSLLQDHQKTIADLRDTLQSKQQVTMQLESKVRDLSYEIKTILQIAEGPQEITSDKPSYATPKELPPEIRESESDHIQTFEEALMLLKRCLDSAQRMPGASHFAKSQRFKDLPFENYALDLRRLFDHFQHEAEGILFVYSHQEEKMLFVTDQIDNLLGISGEKFIKTFQEIIHEGKEDWNKAVNQLSFKNESKVVLSMKTRTGQETPVTCVLGVIPTGLFRNHVLGVLFSDAKTATYKLTT